MLGASFFGKLLRLLSQQLARLVGLVVLLHAGADLVEAGRARRLDVGDLVDHRSVRDVDQVGRVLGVGAEHGRHELRRCAYARDRIGASEGTGGDDFQAVALRRRVQPFAAGLAADAVGHGAHLAGHLLRRDRGLDLRADFVERLQVRFLLVVRVDDVEAEGAAHQTAGLALLQRERGLIELRNGLPVLDPAQRAAVVLAAGIVGILLGQVGEIAARIDLLQDRLGLRLGVGNRFFVHLAVHRFRRLDQDVPRHHLVGHAVFFAVLVVVVLQLFRRDLRLLLQPGGVDDDVARAALLRNSVGVGLLALFVIGLQVGFGRLDLLGDVLQRQHGVVELDLGVLTLVLLGYVLVGDGDASLHGRTQLADEQVLLYERLKRGNGKGELL